MTDPSSGVPNRPSRPGSTTSRGRPCRPGVDVAERVPRVPPDVLRLERKPRNDLPFDAGEELLRVHVVGVRIEGRSLERHVARDLLELSRSDHSRNDGGRLGERVEEADQRRVNALVVMAVVCADDGPVIRRHVPCGAHPWRHRLILVERCTRVGDRGAVERHAQSGLERESIGQPPRVLRRTRSSDGRTVASSHRARAGPVRAGHRDRGRACRRGIASSESAWPARARARPSRRGSLPRSPRCTSSARTAPPGRAARSPRTAAR